MSLPSDKDSFSRAAMAHYIERQIDEGAIPDYAAAARALGLTRARLSQIMNLLLLAPEIQARIAVGELVLTERALRRVSAQRVVRSLQLGL